MEYSKSDRVNSQDINSEQGRQTGIAQFADNRVGSTAQLKLQTIMNASPQAIAQRRLQTSTQSSSARSSSGLVAQLAKEPRGNYASGDQYRVWYQGAKEEFVGGGDPGGTGIMNVSGYDANVEIKTPDEQLYYQSSVGLTPQNRGWHKGHILSKAVGGSGGSHNIFAQDGGQNTAGKWVSFERNMGNKIAAAPDNSQVRFTADLYKELGGDNLQYDVDVSNINSRG